MSTDRGRATTVPSTRPAIEAHQEAGVRRSWDDADRQHRRSGLRYPVSTSSDSATIGGMTHGGRPTGGHTPCRGDEQRATRASHPFSLRAVKKNPEPIRVAVTDFLAGLRLTGSERVLGALALALAEGMDASPGYAKGRLAHELREILMELPKAELSPANLSLLEGVEL